MIKLLWTLLIPLLFAEILTAQGFNSFNERNHPYLDWQVAETEHFRIIFPERLSGIESEAAAIAEESYRVLSRNLEITLNGKVRIYLSDEDEITNGFAVPVGKGHANIWVGLNDYAEIWTGREKWLRKVIAHELAHIFHFHATRTRLGLLNYVIADPMPSFWAEGLAQYQTEQWDSERGERWLRLGIFDSRPDYEDGQSHYNSRLMYASGNAQVRYFNELYGNEAFSELLSQRNSFFGLFDYHNFTQAFRQTADQSYAEFYDGWRRHMNIYYNSLASQMERTDSLSAGSETLPGDYYYDVKYSPDPSVIAVLSLTSLERPIRRLYLVENDTTRTVRVVAEGAIRPGLSWTPDGVKIAYSKRVRGERSSLIHDIFILDRQTGRENRVTHSRRASSPAFGPRGENIAYVVNEGGTGHVVVLDLETGRERYLIRHGDDDVQIINLVWNTIRNEIVFQRFDQHGNRFLVVADAVTGRERLLDDGLTDNRMPVISPDGQRVAFTSLRDEVPNVFIADLQSGVTHRVTNLFTGGEVYDWLEPSGADEMERLVINSSETKRWDAIHLVDATRVSDTEGAELNRAYATWKSREPHHTLSEQIPPDESLISERYSYNSWANLTHAVTLGVPYYLGPSSYGVAAATGWVEPLGKHLLAAGGLLSIGDLFNSYGFFTYVNNQLYPTLTLSGYRSPAPAQFYGQNYLVEMMTGADISMTLPLDRFENRPYQRSWIGSRLRYVSVDPIRIGDRQFSPELPTPQSGTQFDLEISWILKKQRPYFQSLVHPLDGYGVQLRAAAAERLLGTDFSFITAEAGGYTILPGPGRHRLFLSGRFQWQIGEPLPQNYTGFSRLDNVQIPVELGPVALARIPTERVRGYRDFVAGRQVAFLSSEYRMPFLPSLQTVFLGLLELGPTSLVLFGDAGVVWNVIATEESDVGENRVQRLGVGGEVKNIIRVGPLSLVHSVGIAQPYDGLLNEEYELYYRVRASVPF